MRHKTLGTELVAVGQVSMLKALKQVSGCAVCDKASSTPFESLLTNVLGIGGMEMFLCCPAECPRCASPIVENTLVQVGAGTQQLYFEPNPEETDVVFVDEPTLLEAQVFISGCEHCEPERAEISFDQILDSITGCDPTVTEYVICRPACCSRCNHAVMEKTLVLAE
jgi:hypothetical protein